MDDEPLLAPAERDTRIEEVHGVLDTGCGGEDEDELRLELAELLVHRLMSAEVDSDGRIEDVREVSYHCRWLIAASDMWSPIWLWTHYLLGLAHAEGYLIGYDIDDLDSAVAALRVLEEQDPDPESLTLLAELRLRRFYAVPAPDRDIDLITSGVVAARKAVEFNPPVPLRWECETVLGLLAAETIFQHVDEDVIGAPRLEVLETAISLLTTNLIHIGRDSRLRHPAVRTLADLHQTRWSEANLRRPHADRDIELDTSIDYYRQLTEYQSDVADINLLVAALQMRLSERPHPADRYEVQQWLDRLVTEYDVRPDDEHQDAQGDILLGRGRHSGDQELIRKAIATLEPIVTAPMESRTPDDVVFSASISLMQAYSCYDAITLAQLDLAERLVTGTIAPHSDNALDEHISRIWLAAVVAERAIRQPTPAELARARALIRDRLACPIDDVQMTMLLLTALGRLIALDHEPDAPDPRWLPLRMVDEFPETSRTAMLAWLTDRLTGIPPTDADRPAVLAAVGMLAADAVPETTAAAQHRIDRLRPAIDALADASAVLGRSSALRLIIDRRHTALLVELGQVTNDEPMVRRGIESLDALIAVMPVGHPLRGNTLSLFGTAVMLANAVGPSGYRLDHARDALVEACSDEDQDNETRASFMAILAMVEGMLVLAATDRGNVTQALTWLQRAIDLLPLGHPDRIDHQQSIAGLLIDRFQQVGDMQDIEAAIRLLRETLADLLDSDHETNHKEVAVRSDIQRAELLRSAVVGDVSTGPVTDAYLDDLRAQDSSSASFPTSRSQASGHRRTYWTRCRPATCPAPRCYIWAATR